MLKEEFKADISGIVVSKWCKVFFLYYNGSFALEWKITNNKCRSTFLLLTHFSTFQFGFRKTKPRD